VNSWTGLSFTVYSGKQCLKPSPKRKSTATRELEKLGGRKLMLRSSSKKPDKTLKITRFRLISSSTSNKRISNLYMRSIL
jgi:hypothetical protein